MANHKKIYSILIIVIIIVFVVYLAISVNKATNNETKDNSNVASGRFWTFTAEEIGLKIQYPDTWQRYYNYYDKYGFALEFTSSDRTDDIDPLTNQALLSPLVEFSVNQQPNSENLTLSDWINERSAVNDEQERIRKDKDGWLGIRQWIWHKSNAYKFSSVSYYIQKDKEVWTFRADINDDNPYSEQFKKQVALIDKLFDGLEFTASKEINYYDDTITVDTVKDGQQITLPIVNARFTTPPEFFTISEPELDQINGKEMEMNRFCGILPHETVKGNYFGVSYLNSPHPVCGTEIITPFLPDVEKNITDLDDICGSLSKRNDVYGCEQTFATSTSVIAAAEYFQYVPAFSLDEVGTIAKVVYLSRGLNKENNSLLYFLIPKNVSIKESDFKSFVKKLYESDDSSVVNFTSEFGDFSATALNSQVNFK